MKKYIYTFLVVLAAALASCSNDDMAGNDADNARLQQVTINVATDNGHAPATRAATDNIKRYIISVFTDAAYSIPANVFDSKTGMTNTATNADGAFTLTLDRTKTYYCLFWADGGTGCYTLASDGSVKTLTVATNKEVTEAFYAKQTISGHDATKSVTLKRAVAKLTLKENGTMPAGKTMTVTFPQKTTFDLTTEAPSGTEATRTVTWTTTVIEGTPDNPKKLNPDDIFVLAPVASAPPRAVTSQCDAEEAREVPNVPLQANHNTNITGHYTTASAATKTFTVTYDQTWADGDLERTVSKWDGTSTQQPAGYDASTPGTVDITSAAELAWLATVVREDRLSGYTFNLTTDIDLDNHAWTAIGGTSSFCGTFNGQNHTISNLNCNDDTDYARCGLFAGLGDGATVRDLTVDGSVSSSNTVSCSLGGIVGTVQNVSVIENCTNNCTVSYLGTQGKAHVGGIVGRCVNAKATLSNNKNAGTISNNSTADDSGTGAIVGYAWLISPDYSATLTGNSNTGTVPGGAIIGYCNLKNGASVTVDGTSAEAGYPYPKPAN